MTIADRRLLESLMIFMLVKPNCLLPTHHYVMNHSLDIINCVRWNSTGDLLATASWDQSMKVIDFSTGKIIHSKTTPDESKLFT